MTLDDLERKIGVFINFWRFRAATQLYSVRKVSPRDFQPISVEFIHALGMALGVIRRRV